VELYTAWIVFCQYQGDPGALLMGLKHLHLKVLLSLGSVVAFTWVPFQAQQDKSNAHSAAIHPDTRANDVADLPLSRVPKKPISVCFLIRHRSALDGKRVLVRGTIVAAAVGDKACPTGRGMCMQPSIFLSDHRKPSGSVQLRVLLPEKAKEADYLIHRAITISGKVQGNRSGVTLDSSH
jgi:hypothetical protein